MTGKPALFIGSSAEGLEFARALHSQLDRDAEVTPWHAGAFNLGSTYIEDLIARVSVSDFAVLVLTPDDMVESRGEDSFGPRDNVLFELGLFMGALGKHRTLLVRSAQTPLKLPSDLSGLVVADFEWPRTDTNAEAALEPACNRIRKALRDLGPRPKSDRGGGPGWGSLLDALVDGALIDSPGLYVENPEVAREKMTKAINNGWVIPSRYHYSSDALAEKWLDRCQQEEYIHQSVTLDFWGGTEGEAFTKRVLQEVKSDRVDFVSLGPGDGLKDAEMASNWLRAGARFSTTRMMRVSDSA